MNRKIKFRAWDEKGKEMVYENESKSFFGHALLNHDILKRFETVMQFTGLHDKSGKEIYEGDILISDYSEGKHSIICFGEYKDLSDANDDLTTLVGFYWSESDGTTSRFGRSINGDMNYCEVIGNIYENPELIND